MGCGPSSSAAAVSGGAAPAAGDLRVARLAGGDPHSRRVKPPAPWAAPEPV